MAVNKIILVAHAPLASALKECALHVYSCDSRLESRILAYDVLADADIRAVADTVIASMGGSSETRFLVLTDLFGASPANIAADLLKHEGVAVLTGANLPMLLSAICQIDQPLEVLVNEVAKAGVESVGVYLSGGKKISFAEAYSPIFTDSVRQ